MTQRVHVIGNPRAGRGSVGSSWEELLGRLREAGREVTGDVTEAPGHGIELARQARRDGADLVVAAGGDGTVHEVVNGLLADGAGPPMLGVLPMGSGCDYAKTFELPSDVAGAVDRFTSEAQPLVVDAGEIRCRRGEEEIGRYFVNIAEVGIGSEVVARATRMPRLLGPAMYLAAFWLTLPRYEQRMSSIRMSGGHVVRGGSGGRSAPGQMDEEIYEGPLTDLVVAVGQVFGGGMRVAPEADPSDGLFDVQVHWGSKADYVKGIAKVYRGTHLPHPRIREERAAVVEVTCTPRGLIEADGEIVGHTPATFRTVPGALRLKA